MFMPRIVAPVAPASSWAKYALDFKAYSNHRPSTAGSGRYSGSVLGQIGSFNLLRYNLDQANASPDSVLRGHHRVVEI